MGTASSIAKSSSNNCEDGAKNYEIADEVREYKNRNDDGTSPIRRTLSGIRSFSLKKSSSSKANGAVKKSTSLRSTRSVEVESESATIKREYEFYRLCTTAKIAGLELDKDKLEDKNRRLRGELKIQQQTYTKLRNEREVAHQAEDQALQRAAALEKERDKLRRDFKTFRESKEKEVQDILFSKREIENKLKSYCDSDEFYTTHDDTLSMPDDWFTSSFESEPSLNELSQSNVPVKGLESIGVLLEKDGPFTNINREDWQAVIPSVMQILSTGFQSHLQPVTIKIYLSSPSDMEKEVEIMMKVHVPVLQRMCEKKRKFLCCIHFSDSKSCSQDCDREQLMRMEKIKQCKAFVAFLGRRRNSFTNDEYQCAHLKKPGKLFSVFCFKNTECDSPQVSDEVTQLTEKLKTEIRKTRMVKLFDSYESADIGAELAFRELEAFMKRELGLDDVDGEKERKFEGPEDFELDILDDYEQVETLRTAASWPCEIGLGKYYSELNEYTASDAPQPPILILSEPGAGKTVLLAKWIAMQQSSMSGSLVLYHFVGSPSSSSANPALMLRRFTIQLMRQVAVSPCLAGDPVQLKEEFVRWLERVSLKVEGGVTIVIDSADRLQGGAGYMKWLLDPLPVGARVVLSASEKTCHAVWKSWRTLRLSRLEEKESKYLLVSCWNNSNIPLTSEQLSRIMCGCSPEASSNPRFLSLLASETRCCKDSQTLSQWIAVIWSKKDVVSLLCHILNQIEVKYLGPSNRHLLKDILLSLFVSRNGLNESELVQLVPVDWLLWIPLSEELHHRNILTNAVGLIRFGSEQVREAVVLKYLTEEEDEEDANVELHEAFGRLTDFFSERLRINHITYRLVDELPWQLKRSGKLENLRKCLKNFKIFAMFFERGRVSELVEYWHELGVDHKSLGNIYLSAVKEAEAAGEESAAEIADMYEIVGRFLKCLRLHNQALQPLQKALEIREVVTDPDGPLVAQSLHHLAECNAHCGKLSLATTFFKQALEIKENALGRDHPSLTKELEGLALLFRKNDKPSMADPFHKRAISIRKRTMGLSDLRRKTIRVEELALGSCNPEVSNSLNELGVLYYLQNNHESAKSFFQRSLEMREVVLGSEHPDVAQSLNNLAALYNDQKQYDKAQPLYERALKIRLKALPKHHASVASTVKHLAVLYKKQGMYSAAEPLYRQAVEAQEKLGGGPNHPSVATALNNLAVVLCLQEKQTEALPLYERALRIYEESKGTNHSRVAETLRNLSKLHLDLGDKKTAAQLYKQASEIRDSDVASSQAGLSFRSFESESSSYNGNPRINRTSGSQPKLDNVSKAENVLA